MTHSQSLHSRIFTPSYNHVAQVSLLIHTQTSISQSLFLSLYLTLSLSLSLSLSHTHTHTHTHTHCATLQAQGEGSWAQCPEAPGANPAKCQAGTELGDKLRGHGGLPSCTDTLSLEKGRSSQYQAAPGQRGFGSP